jgi:Domain of unknown function (DUF1840)
MLVRFKSVATEDLTMFDNVAVPLIRMLGATGNIPGGLSADDLPSAISRLRSELARAQPVPAESNDDARDKDREPPVALAARAMPLMQILERAAKAHEAVMWEKM